MVSYRRGIVSLPHEFYPWLNFKSKICDFVRRAVGQYFQGWVDVLAMHQEQLAIALYSL